MVSMKRSDPKPPAESDHDDSLPGIEDSANLAGWLSADEHAFGRFVLVFQVAVFAFLSRMGFDAATTADLAQDAFRARLSRARRRLAALLENHNESN